ncbi:MAG TPA: M48 family metalloprotease [Acidimicrobiales bacterium]|nr:M48 family metalloprotease [Acidimicrobiales bacterium]
MSGGATVGRARPPWLAPSPSVTGLLGAGVDPVARRSSVRSTARLLRRDLRTPSTALLASWTGAVVLLWAAALGAVLGVLVAIGVLSAKDTRGLFHVGPPSGLRPWHVLDGALVGAGGTAATVAGSIFGSPWWVGAWLFAGLASALAALALLLRHEDQLLRLRHARPPTMAELRHLAPVAQLAGAPFTGADPTRLLLVESSAATFRVHARHVVLTTALLQQSDDGELAALLCHALHHLESGAGARRAFVVACGWPVLLLSALGNRLGRAGNGNRELLWAVSWLLLWPARLLAHLVAVASERDGAREEFEADARARRVGLGSQLVVALRTLPAAECGDSVAGRASGRAWLSAALRVERLETSRPLDGFFGGRAPARSADDTRWRWALAAAGVTVLVLTAGAIWSNGAKAAGGVPGEETAADTAAAYTVSYLDAAFRPGGLHRVIRRSVPSSMVTAVEARAATSPLALASALVAGRPSTSHASVLGCHDLATGARRAVAGVVVRVRWVYDVAGVGHRRVTTSTVTLRLMDGRWRPTGVPALSPGGGRAPVASGFGPCAL